MDLSKDPKNLSPSEDEYLNTAKVSTAEGANAGEEGVLASTSTQDVTSDTDTEPYSPSNFQPIPLEEQSGEEEENNETDDEKRTQRIKVRGQKWQKDKHETGLLIIAPPLSPLSAEGSPGYYHEENYPLL